MSNKCHWSSIMTYLLIAKTISTGWTLIHFYSYLELVLIFEDKLKFMIFSELVVVVDSVVKVLQLTSSQVTISGHLRIWKPSTLLASMRCQTMLLIFSNFVEWFLMRCGYSRTCESRLLLLPRILGTLFL